MLNSLYSDKFEKYSPFETFHIKTQNHTKNCIPLGTNITNDARNDWTLHLHPLRASMFSNERTIPFLDLSNSKPNRIQKSFKTPLVFHQNTSYVQRATFFPNTTHFISRWPSPVLGHHPILISKCKCLTKNIDKEQYFNNVYILIMYCWTLLPDTGGPGSPNLYWSWR